MRLLLVFCSGCIFISKAQYEADYAALYGDTGGASCDGFPDPDALGMAGLTDLGSADATIYGGDGYRALGYGIAGLGDIDGDGRDDIGIGYDSGAMVLFSAPTGESTAFDASGDFQLTGAVQSYGYVYQGHFRPAGAGDVDGDGSADLLLTADLGDEDSGSSPGIYAVLGPINDRAGAETSTILDTPALRDPLYPFWQADVPGDLDGDGRADLLVAASNDDGDAGAVAVLSGAALDEGCAQIAGCGQSRSTSEGNLYDAMVTGAQDTTGDGVPDVLIGAPYAGNGDGAVWLLDGAELGAELDGGALSLATEDALRLGDATADGGYIGGLGYSVAGVGDVDEDGLADVLIGAPFGGVRTALLIVDGGRHEVALAAPEDGAPGATNFGDSAIAAGDVNGDCVPDIAVTALAYQDTDPGAVFVYLGGADLVAVDTVAADQALRLALPAGADTTLSLSAAAAGDPDADGYGDLLISVQTWEPDGESAYQGVVWYVRGGPG